MSPTIQPNLKTQIESSAPPLPERIVPSPHERIVAEVVEGVQFFIGLVCQCWSMVGKCTRFIRNW